MATKDLGDLIVRLSLDSAKFEDGLKRFETQMTKVQSEFKNSATGVTDFDKATAKLRTSADTLTERLGMQKDKVAQLEAAYQKSVETKGADAEETKKLAAQLEAARGKVEQTEKALASVNSEIAKNENSWYRLSVNLQGVGEKLQQVGKQMADVGKQMSMKVTAPIVALGTACVKTFTSFDDSMRTVQATMNASEEDMQKLTAAAKEMGATTRFSASESASALNYLALAGYTADQAIEALPKVLNLAAAGGLDLAYASDLVTDSMSALGLEMDELTGFTDKMAVTAQRSNTNVAQLGEAILTVGGTAKNLSGGVTEMNTVLGILADNGIKGSEAGTKLRNMILSLSAPTDASAKKMKELGLQAFDANGNLRPMNEIFRDLDGILSTMTQEERTNVLNELFNKTDLGAANALLSNCGDRFDELSAAISNADGAATIMANTMEGGIGGSFRNLKSAVEGLAISFGERLAPFVKQVADKITELTRKFTQLSPQTQDMIIKVAAIAAAIGPLLLIGGKLISGVGTAMKLIAPLVSLIGGVSTSTGVLGSVLTALTGPVGIVIAAVAAVIAIFVAMYNTNDEFRAKVDALWARIVKAFNTAKEAVGRIFSGFAANFEPIKEKLGELWEKVQVVFNKIWDFLEPLIEVIGVIIGLFVTYVVGIFSGIANAISPMIDAVSAAIDFVIGIFDALIAFLSGDFEGAWNALKGAFSSLWDVIVNVFTAIGAYFTGFWEGICTFLDAFGIDLGSLFSGIWEGISSGLQTAWNAITGWLSGAWNGIKDTAGTVWNGITEGIGSAVDTAKTGLTTAWNTISTTVSTTWNNLKTTASTVWSNMTQNVNTIVTNAKAGIQTAWTNITTGVSSAWDGLKGTVSTVWSAITDGVKTATDSGKNPIVAAWEGVKGGISAVWDLLPDCIKSPLLSIQSWITEKVEFFKNLFNFQWKLPEFKLPKISVKWNDIGWGISLPSLSLSWNALGGIFRTPTIFATGNGLQGVGEKGAEAILPLDTLWDEMSQRLKQGMREVLRDVMAMPNEQQTAIERGIATGIRQGLQGLQGLNMQANQKNNQPPIELVFQVDGQTFARVMLPYMDTEQAQAWGRKLQLAMP